MLNSKYVFPTQLTSSRTDGPRSARLCIAQKIIVSIFFVVANTLEAAIESHYIYKSKSRGELFLPVYLTILYDFLDHFDPQKYI